MKLQFTKMQALGNDFLVLDGVRQTINLSPSQIRQWANRHTGIGFDQLLLISSATQTGADFNYRIFNADGQEVEQCGNGARCVARFIVEQGLTDQTHLSLQTLRGLITTDLIKLDQVKASLGVPEFTQQQIRYELAVANQLWQIGIVSVGNPHAVLQVDSVITAPVTTLGPEIEHHSLFPHRTNVEFMECVNRTQIKLRVWERGVGETQACGTGACAAVIMGQLWGSLDQTVEVILPGGKLSVEWHGIGQPVYLTGPAETVFTGYIDN